ncbi:hypothetical protein NW768_002706 [Fusarium equiseti]|uniref:NACHT domain-containing protein n=1 Tax=Fusarium equiseti TaxID=61235 RepID=A0ABQ8RK55_FUSEQ|nr:hypothetical protein NW768_002706 [Fusarium equiseti]
MYQELIGIELKSHLCSQSDAIRLQQEQSFQKLDNDIQFLVNQLAQGVTEVLVLVKTEHAATRAVVTQETVRAEKAINTHIDTQVVDMKTTAEENQQHRIFLRSLKAECMNQRYNDVLDPRDASFNSVFATYQELVSMYDEDSEDDYESEEGDYSEHDQVSEGDDPDDDQDSQGDDDDSEVEQLSERSSDLSRASYIDAIWSSWNSFISWLQSDETLFYIQEKPGSGKSTLVKFILDDDRTRDLIQQWNYNATIIRYFFWKIRSHEQNSIKGLWCSPLYQRLQDRPSLIPDILQHLPKLSSHTSYHDWTIKDLQAVWEFTINLENRHLCIFIDGLDKVRNQDGFSGVVQSIQLISKSPKTKLCVSTRPEAQIIRWLEGTGSGRLRLEDLTKHDMIVFVQKDLSSLLPKRSDLSQHLCHELVSKAQGVFLWLHLAMRNIIEGIENGDSQDMLFCRLHGLPGDLETLYMDMWQRLNANNGVYGRTAARYLRYVLLSTGGAITFNWNESYHHVIVPFNFQIACAEIPEIQELLLVDGGTIETARARQMCEETKVSIRTRCAGLLEFQPKDDLGPTRDKYDTVSNALGQVTLIHRTAHDFLMDTEAGRRILGHDSSSDFNLRWRLLKGLICCVVSLSDWGLAWHLDTVITEIIRSAESRRSAGRGNSGLEVVFVVLDITRPLYDKKCIKTTRDKNNYQPPFFSFLSHDDRFNGFIILRLAAARSVQMATETLREGWTRGFRRCISKRLFDALIALAAEPHKYKVRSHNTIVGPCAFKATALTCLLSSFYVSSLRGPRTRKAIEMAIYMTRGCYDLNLGVSFFGRFSQNATMIMDPLEHLPRMLQSRAANHTRIVVYKTNLQFLLLYLLSGPDGSPAESLLVEFEADDLLPKVGNPWAKTRCFLLPKLASSRCQTHVPWTFHRVTPQASYIPENLVEYFLLCPSDSFIVTNRLKDDFQGQLNGMYVFQYSRADLSTVSHDIQESEIQEVGLETMMTDLAHGSPDTSTHEKADITTSTA